MCSNLKKARTEAFCWYIPKAMSLSINSYLINLSENPQSKIGNAEINGFIKKKPSFFYMSLCFAYNRNKWYCSTYELSQDSRLVTNNIWEFSWCWKGVKLPPPWSIFLTFRSLRQLQNPEGSLFLIFKHS